MSCQFPRNRKSKRLPRVWGSNREIAGGGTIFQSSNNAFSTLGFKAFAARTGGKRDNVVNASK